MYISAFGVRPPQFARFLTLALIKLSGLIAAPSANASTKPSTTTAEHVKHDLGGRIEIILDRGPCTVGVESTVIDGLSQPPCILRPGGISLEQLKQCESWEGVVVGYSNGWEEKPRAPGMKYRHYSPNALVILYKAGCVGPAVDTAQNVGIIRTMCWQSRLRDSCSAGTYNNPTQPSAIPTLCSSESAIWEIWLGTDLQDIARDLFSALRELDEAGVGVIHFEGIPETDDLAATIMNRLRKAAVTVR